MHNIKLLDIDLRLFDGAAGAAGGEGAAAGATQAGESALPKAEIKGTRGGSRRGQTGAYDNVVFGKQEDAPAVETQSSDAGSTEGEGNAKTSGPSIVMPLL